MIREIGLLVEDLTRPGCGERLEAALRWVDGVVEASVAWQAGMARIDHAASSSVVDLVRTVEAESGTSHRHRASIIFATSRDAPALALYIFALV